MARLGKFDISTIWWPVCANLTLLYTLRLKGLLNPSRVALLAFRTSFEHSYVPLQHGMSVNDGSSKYTISLPKTFKKKGEGEVTME